MKEYPDKIASLDMLEDLLSIPTAEAVKMFSGLEGDIMFLRLQGWPNVPVMKRALKNACMVLPSSNRRNSVKSWKLLALKPFMEIYWTRTSFKACPGSKMFTSWQA